MAQWREPPAAAASADWSSAQSWASPCICCTQTSPPPAACVGGGDGGGGGVGEGAGGAVGWGVGGGVGALVPSHGEAQGRSLTAPEAPGNIPGARCSSFAPRWHLGNNSPAQNDQNQCFPDERQAGAAGLWLLCRTQSETCSSNPPDQIVPFWPRLRGHCQLLPLL